MDRCGRSGFSLLELAVALLFTGILMGGMFRVCLAGLGSWTRVNEALGAQRELRWALDRAAQDLRMLGHRFPPGPGGGPDLRSAIVLLPDQPVRTAGGGDAPGSPDGGLRKADELSFTVDLPVPGTLRVWAGPAGTVRVRAARALSLLPGDLLLVPGERFQCAAVDRAVDLPAGETGPVCLAPGSGPAIGSGGPRSGSPAQVVRPHRAVRYAVVRVRPEPCPRGAGPVPCLVRFEAACPGDGSAPRWCDLLEGPEGPGKGWEVVARNVAGFRADFTPDARFPGIRGATGAETAANLDTRLQALHGREGGGRAGGSLVQLRLETRSPVARSEYGGGCLHRAQTLVVAPRHPGEGW